MNETCLACFKPIENNDYVLHHKSYFPEIKIKVHNKCHRAIHKGTAYKNLLPPKNHARLFYTGSTEKKTVRPEINEENFEDVIILANKNSQIPVRDFNDAITILLTLVIPGRRSKWPLEKSVE